MKSIRNRVAYLNNECKWGWLRNAAKKEYSSACFALKKNTRNYAKRQLTWFRRNNEIKWDIFPEKLKK